MRENGTLERANEEQSVRAQISYTLFHEWVGYARAQVCDTDIPTSPISQETAAFITWKVFHLLVQRTTSVQPVDMRDRRLDSFN